MCVCVCGFRRVCSVCAQEALVCVCFPGPLFSFDVHDDIRLVNDATVEKDEVRLPVNEGWTPQHDIIIINHYKRVLK